jgi:hypothetical protein
VEAVGAGARSDDYEPVGRDQNVRERCLDIGDTVLHTDGGVGSEGFAGASESDVRNTASLILIVIASGTPSPTQDRTYHRSSTFGWFVGSNSIVACPTILGHVQWADQRTTMVPFIWGCTRQA